MCLEFLTKIHLFRSGDLVFIGNVLAELFDIHIIWELEPIIVSKLYLGMCCGVGKIRLLSRNRSSSSPHFFFSTCLQKAVFLFFLFLDKPHNYHSVPALGLWEWPQHL